MACSVGYGAVAAQYADAKKLASTVTSTNESLSRADRLTALSNLADTSMLTAQRCEGDWWSGWYANVVSSAGEGRAACNRQLEQLRSMTKVATQLSVCLTDDQKIATSMDVVTPTAAKENWQTAALSSADSPKGR